RPQAVANSFDGLEREAAGNVVLGVRSWNDIDRLHFLLQRTNGILDKLCLVVEKWADHFFPGRTDAQAISRLVVGPEGQALPHGRRLRISYFLAVVQGVLAIGD